MQTITKSPQASAPRGAAHRAHGLTEAQAQASRREHGANVMTPHKRRSFARRFLSNLGDPVIKILLCALCINLIFMFRRADWFETIGIAVSVFLATLISTLSEYGSEAAFTRLEEESDRILCRVRRDGTVRELPIDELVVGDVVLLGAGEAVPADGILLTGRIDVDQVAMTGENREVHKTPLPPGEAAGDANPNTAHWLLRSCPVLAGEGEMLVCAVGDGTFIGEIAHEIMQETRESPLKLRLGRLARQISRLGYIAAVLVALADLFHAFVLSTGGSPAAVSALLSDLPQLFETLFHAFTLGLTVVVMAVPEGYYHHS